MDGRNRTMRLNPYWRLQMQCLLLACAGLVLYAVAVTDGFRAVGAVICGLSVALTISNLISEAVRTLRRTK